MNNLMMEQCFLRSILKALYDMIVETAERGIVEFQMEKGIQSKSHARVDEYVYS